MMYRSLRLVCAVTVLSTTCVLVSPSASAETEIFRYRAKGEGAHAHFFKVDPTGCFLTETFVDVLDARYRTGLDDQRPRSLSASSSMIMTSARKPTYRPSGATLRSRLTTSTCMG